MSYFHHMVLSQSLPIFIRDQLVGNSCKIGNTRLLGTSKNQNHQLCEICHFCLIFTLQQYIVAQKLIRQPYCSFNQHFVACQRKFSVPRRRRQNIQRIWPGKSVHSAQIKCKKHHLMLKSISRSIYVLFFHFHLVHVPSNYVPRRSKVRQIQTLIFFRFSIVRLKTILLIDLS